MTAAKYVVKVETQETNLHAVRDCKWITDIWKKHVHPSRWRDFKNKGLKAWIDWNLNEKHIGCSEDVNWQLIFQQVIYYAQKARNEFCIMSNGSKLRVNVGHLVDQVEEVQKNWIKRGSGRTRELHLISWKPPPQGWVKINVDGASATIQEEQEEEE